MSPSTGLFPSRLLPLLLLPLLLPYLALCLPASSGLHPLFRRQSPSSSSSQSSLPPSVSPPHPAQFPSQQFAAHAFASKLAAPVVPPPPFEGSIAQPGPGATSPPAVPQFVANNGPLVRAPDGQFVLAPTRVSPPHFAPFSGHSPPPFGPSVQVPGSSPPPDLPPSTPDPDPASSSPSAADSPPPATAAASTPPVDRSVDLDGDGALSLNEVQYAAFVHHGLSSSVVENLFNEVDHNRDGYLNSFEFNDIRPLVLAKAENAALRYLQNVDSDHNGMLSLAEAQAFILKEYGISNRDVERIWRLVVPSSGDEMDAVLFSKLRRRVRGMSIRLARQIMKGADRDEDGHIDLREAQLIAFEQEGIGPGEVVEMLASVDDNNDGKLNAPEFADFERIVRARAVETAKKALKVVDTDGSGTLTMDEAKRIAFDHYAFDEATLEPFFAQADENEDGQLDAVEFAGFRSVIRGRAVKNAEGILAEMDEDGNGMISEAEAEQRTRREDELSAAEARGLFAVADQDKNGQMDKVELADFVRLVRLSSIKFVTDHLRDYDHNRDRLVTLDELEKLFGERNRLEPLEMRRVFERVDVDRNGDLSPGEIVDFRREIRKIVQDKMAQLELDEQNRRETMEIEQKLRKEAAEREMMENRGREDERGRTPDEGGNGRKEKKTTQGGDDNEAEFERDDGAEERRAGPEAGGRGRDDPEAGRMAQAEERGNGTTTATERVDSASSMLLSPAHPDNINGATSSPSSSPASSSTMAPPSSSSSSPLPPPESIQQSQPSFQPGPSASSPLLASVSSSPSVPASSTSVIPASPAESSSSSSSLPFPSVSSSSLPAVLSSSSSSSPSSSPSSTLLTSLQHHTIATFASASNGTTTATQLGGREEEVGGGGGGGGITTTTDGMNRGAGEDGAGTTPAEGKKRRKRRRKTTTTTSSTTTTTTEAPGEEEEEYEEEEGEEAEVGQEKPRRRMRKWK